MANNNLKPTGLRLPESFIDEIDTAAQVMFESRSGFIKNAILQRIEDCKKKYSGRFKEVAQ